MATKFNGDSEINQKSAEDKPLLVEVMPNLLDLVWIKSIDLMIGFYGCWPQTWLLLLSLNPFYSLLRFLLSLQSVRPRPIPEGLISSKASIFPKTINNLVRSSSLIPIPESSTDMITFTFDWSSLF